MFISYAKGKLVWVEAQSDPRWENREYSVIKLMDLKSKRSENFHINRDILLPQFLLTAPELLL